jgi:hypothetical protein
MYKDLLIIIIYISYTDIERSDAFRIGFAVGLRLLWGGGKQNAGQARLLIDTANLIHQ